MRDPLRAFLNTPAAADLDTDEKLIASGWAAGLDVLTEMYDVYCENVGSLNAERVAHAQVRSLLQALSDQAWRGSHTEAWIKRHRDQFSEHRHRGGAAAEAWRALDELLDDYRDHSDVGRPLSDDTPIGPAAPGEQR